MTHIKVRRETTLFATFDLNLEPQLNRIRHALDGIKQIRGIEYYFMEINTTAYTTPQYYTIDYKVKSDIIDKILIDCDTTSNAIAIAVKLKNDMLMPDSNTLQFIADMLGLHYKQDEIQNKIFFHLSPSSSPQPPIAISLVLQIFWPSNDTTVSYYSTEPPSLSTIKQQILDLINRAITTLLNDTTISTIDFLLTALDAATSKQ